jgi:hypothetical protein
MADSQEFMEKYKENADKLVALARLMETADRFEDMCKIMGKLVELKKKGSEGLEVEERNMLSVAYKNVVGQRRASWRTLTSDPGQQEQDQTDSKLKENYRKMVEAELEGKCREVLTLIENSLVDKGMDPNTLPETMDDVKRKEVETQVFYLKMCGDYYRYLAEFSENAKYKTNAGKKYEAAMNLAKQHLAPTHPTRLGLALNASVCYYEIMKEAQKACKLAKEAFDEAIQKLDSLSDSTYKDSTLIMQLLRDNLTIWTSESQDNANVEEHED